MEWNGFDETMIYLLSLHSTLSFLKTLPYMYSVLCTLLKTNQHRHIKPPHSTPTNLNVPTPFSSEGGLNIRFVRLSMSGEVRFII